MRLKEIAEISLGYSFRSRIAEDLSGNVFVLQPKNIDENTCIALEDAIKFNISKLKQRLILMKNDILLTNRGRFKAAVFSSSSKINYVASSSIFIIRIKERSFLPGYVSLFLNSIAGQKQMNMLVETMTIPSMSMENVKNLNIANIPIKKQQQLVWMEDDYKNYKELFFQKTNLMGKLVDNVINRVLNKQGG